MNEFENTTRERGGLDRVTDHEFDGIQEFDNKLPNWWLWIMWGSIIFSLFYWLVFQTLQLRDSPLVDFETSMIVAQEAELARMSASGISNESLLLMSGIPAKVNEGRELFATHCVACHLDRGQGLIGPNLTDAYWINGCEPLQIHATLVNGVTAKGMPAWQNQLGPSRVQALAAFVLSLKGTNVPGKAPEGEACEF